MSKVKKFFRAILIIILIFVLIIGVLLALLAIPVKPEWFSENFHMKNVTKYAQEYYVGKNGCTSVEIYPVYDENEKLTHFIIEKQPEGFQFVTLMTRTILIGSLYNHTGYIISWNHYRICAENEKPIGESFFDDDNVEIVCENGTFWKHAYPQVMIDPKTGNKLSSSYSDILKLNAWAETDEQGNFVFQSESPYRVYGVKNEKRYLLKVRRGDYVPAIKSENGFINLITLQEISWPDQKPDAYPSMFVASYVP